MQNKEGGLMKQKTGARAGDRNENQDTTDKVDHISLLFLFRRLSVRICATKQDQREERQREKQDNRCREMNPAVQRAGKSIFRVRRKQRRSDGTNAGDYSGDPILMIKTSIGQEENA